LVVFNQLNTNMTIIRGVIFFPPCKLIDNPWCLKICFEWLKYYNNCITFDIL
jgi:hypothetical protein